MKTNESSKRVDRDATKRTTADGDLDESLTSDHVSTKALVTPEIPANFGRYHLVSCLGRGGMGSVYLAEDSQLGRQVALKIPRFSEDHRARAIERFQREARAAAVLNHPNLCPVYDVGDFDGVPYITMAFIEGRPLGDYIHADKGLPQPQVAALVRKMALAMAEAHAKGITHRDLKPANIMINQRKEPIIMDFGLAQLDSQEGARLTRAGAVLGTPSYMPPEQVDGDLRAIGPASDIYSLGVILYEMLTGRLPFEGPTSAVYGQIMVAEPTPPSAYRQDLDPRLESICLKAMAKKINERYASMKEMAAAIESFMRSSNAAGGTAKPDIQQAASAPAKRQPKPTQVETRSKVAPKSTMIEPPPAPIVTKTSPPRKPDHIAPNKALARRGPGRKVLLAGGLVVAIAVAAVIVTLSIIRVETKAGTVVIDIRDEGAMIAIDGKNRVTITDAGTKDAVRIEVDEGAHEMIVTKAGFKSHTQRFEIKKGESTAVLVRLEPLPKDKPSDTELGKTDSKGRETGKGPELPKKTDSAIGKAPDKTSKPIVVDRSYWKSFMPTADEARKSGHNRYRNDGLLIVTGVHDWGSGFGTRESGPWAHDVAVRVNVKIKEGEKVWLCVRGSDGLGFDGAFPNYAVSFDGQEFHLQKSIARGKQNRDIPLKQVAATKKFDDFFEFKLKALGDVITVEADGEEVIRVHDSDVEHGGVLWLKVASKCTAEVKSADYQILDFTGGVPPEDKQFFPREKWFSIDPRSGVSWGWDKENTGRIWKRMDKDGVLTLNNGAMDFNALRAKNVSVEAQIKFISGDQDGHVALSLRSDKMKSYYTACNRKKDGTFVVWMNDQGIERNNVPRDFFKLKVTAIADLVTVHLNGEEIIRYRDPDLTMQKVGWVGINAFNNCHVQIKELQAMVMD